MSKWTLKRRTIKKNGFYIKDETNRPLFWIEPLGSGDGDTDKIIAAPAMYEALKAFVDNWNPECGYSNPFYHEVEKGIAALALAKGEK